MPQQLLSRSDRSDTNQLMMTTNAALFTQTTDHWIVEVFPVGPLRCNCVIVGHRTTSRAVVVDPGGDADHILSRLAAHALTLVQIVHTHAHFDHILAAQTLRDHTGAPVLLHPNDRVLWDNVAMQCELFGCAPPSTPLAPPDDDLEHEQPLACGGTVLFTPGHTPGSVCFHFQDVPIETQTTGLALSSGSSFLVAGDTLFRRSVGRTDLWGGDQQALVTSIQGRLFGLTGDALVVTGHGPLTTLDGERRHNPYVGQGV